MNPTVPSRCNGSSQKANRSVQKLDRPGVHHLKGLKSLALGMTCPGLRSVSPPKELTAPVDKGITPIRAQPSAAANPLLGPGRITCWS